MLTLTAALASLLLAGTPAVPGKEPAKKDASCHSEAATAAAAKPGPAKGEVVARGEKLSGKSKKVTVEQLLAAPEKHEGQPVLVEAKVRKACSKKGCWMELGPEGQPGVRVTFKDYGFFVPLDAQGASAKVEGSVKVAQLSEVNAQHLEEEGAAIARDPDGKPREVRLVATGVELRR